MSVRSRSSNGRSWRALRNHAAVRDAILRGVPVGAWRDLIKMRILASEKPEAVEMPDDAAARSGCVWALNWRSSFSKGPLMIPLDSEMGCTTALVIDSNNASRGVLVSLLREFGVAEVTQA